MYKSFACTPSLPTGIAGNGRAKARVYYFLNVPAVPCKCGYRDFLPGGGGGGGVDANDWCSRPLVDVQSQK